MSKISQSANASTAEVTLSQPSKQNRVIKGLLLFASHAKKIMTSRPIGYASKIVGAAFAISTFVAGGPVTAAIIGSLVLGGIVVNIAIDVLQTRRLEKLERENNLLVHCRDRKDQIQEIFNKNPKLKEALIPDVLSPIQSKKLERSTAQVHDPVVHGFWKSVLKNGLSIAADLLDLGSSIVLGSLSSIAIIGQKGAKMAMSHLFSVASDAHDQIGIETIQKKLEDQIATEKAKPDCLEYSSLKELESQAKTNTLIAATIEYMSTRNDLSSMNKEDIQTLFVECFDKISDIISDKKPSTLDKIASALTSGIKILADSQNPYSSINTGKVEIKTSQKELDAKPISKSTPILTPTEPIQETALFKQAQKALRKGAKQPPTDRALRTQGAQRTNDSGRSMKA